MIINLINSSIISSIAAIDFSKSLSSDIYLKPGELLDFNRYFSINEFSKIYLDNLGIWNQLDKEKYNAPNLKKILLDKNINKIFHFARADLLFIKKYLGVNTNNVNCTKIMSKN